MSKDDELSEGERRLSDEEQTLPTVTPMHAEMRERLARVEERTREAREQQTEIQQELGEVHEQMVTGDDLEELKETVGNNKERSREHRFWYRFGSVFIGIIIGLVSFAAGSGLLVWFL